MIGYDPKNNYAASIAPTGTDDLSTGYSVGSEWIVPSTGDIYKCVVETRSAAVWKYVSTT